MGHNTSVLLTLIALASACERDECSRSGDVQSGARQIHLLHTEDPVIPPQGHVAVVCPDYAPTLDALREAGFEVDERARHWGEPRCFTRSPGGHRVEVMAAPPT